MTCPETKDNYNKLSIKHVVTSYDCLVSPTHYANMSLQYAAIFIGCKNDIFI